ncbi:hypothetical protein WA158_000520 [Blastocystis sp. Blastoise]
MNFLISQLETNDENQFQYNQYHLKRRKPNTSEPISQDSLSFLFLQPQDQQFPIQDCYGFQTNDIIQTIFTYLDYESLESCSKVSRYWNNIVMLPIIQSHLESDRILNKFKYINQQSNVKHTYSRRRQLVPDSPISEISIWKPEM